MKSLMGLILGVIGSVFSMVFSIILLIFSILILLGRRALIDNNLSEKLIDFAGTVNFWMFLITIWLLACGVVGIIGSSMMNNPYKTREGGFYCLIAGILCINLFLVVGGIIGIVQCSSEVVGTTTDPGNAAKKYQESIINKSLKN